MDSKHRKKGKSKTKKSKKKKKPIDDEAVALAAENAKRELCEFLATKTDLTEEELLTSHGEFHEKYPAGEINKKQFLEQSKVSLEWSRFTWNLQHKISLKAGPFLAEALFRVFDEDGSGNLDFSEFVQVRGDQDQPRCIMWSWLYADLKANNVKNLDTPEAKLGWMFDAYDADGGGTVDAEEITSIVVGLFRSHLHYQLSRVSCNPLYPPGWVV